MKHKRFVSFVAVFLAALMAVSVLFSLVAQPVAAADSSADIKKNITSLQSDAKKLEERKAKLQAEIAANKDKTLSTIEKKSQLDQQIEITRLEIQNLNDQIREYNLLIAETQKRLDEGLAQQAELNARYKARIRAMEENGRVSYWSILFKASSFSDLIDRIFVINEIASSDQMMLDEMKKNNESIAALRAEIQADREALQKKSQELEALNTSLAAQKNEAEVLLKTLASESASLGDNYAALEAEEAAVRAKIVAEQARYQKALDEEEAKRKAEEERKRAEEEARRAEEERNKQNSGGYTGSTGGTFLSPLPKGSARVTDAFGYRIHPIYGYYAMHYGVDLAANRGTPVYAIASGYVSIATYHSVNGNYVSIAHSDGYGSIYCHLDSYVVSKGAYVKAGQLLGYVGSTGWATGPHLHFEIHENGTAVNPMKYITLS